MPTVPISRFVDDETIEPPLSTQQTVHQSSAQLDCDALPILEPADVRRAQRRARRLATETYVCALNSNGRRQRTVRGKAYQLARQSPTSLESRDSTCGARTRAGTPCKNTNLWWNGRCRFHGGLSTGPRTEQGRRQSAVNGKRGGRPRKRIAEQG
jgi:hypothetical protein